MGESLVQHPSFWLKHSSHVNAHPFRTITHCHCIVNVQNDSTDDIRLRVRLHFSHIPSYHHILTFCPTNQPDVRFQNACDVWFWSWLIPYRYDNRYYRVSQKGFERVAASWSATATRLWQRARVHATLQYPIWDERYYFFPHNIFTFYICRAASAIMDALSRLSVLYQDSSLIATSGGRKTSVDAAVSAASSVIGKDNLLRDRLKCTRMHNIK